MLRTKLCDLLGIKHPIIQAPMGGHTSPELVAAVTNGGGLGVHGAAYFTAEEQREAVARTRQLTDGSFGLNQMLVWRIDDTGETPPVAGPYAYDAGVEHFSATLDDPPRVMSTSWRRSDQDLRPYFDRAHDAGALIMHMSQGVPDAVNAVECGADIIVAQGTDGGGHVGFVGTFSLVPQVVRAVAPVPVVAAGGVCNGQGLAAALALGAQGALMGTRFLATEEAPVPPNYKKAIVASDGHDTLLTDLTDISEGIIWPGGAIRIQRNGLVQRWLGQEPELRRHQHQALSEINAARERDDADGYWLQHGQAAGLVESVQPAAKVVADIAAEAETVLQDMLQLGASPTGVAQ